VIELTFFLSWLKKKKSFYQIPTPKCDKKDMGVIPHHTMVAFENFYLKAQFVISTFKIDTTNVPLFCQMYYSVVSKIENCLKYFLDKNSKNSASVKVCTS
jgi:hypothetical protein